MQHGYVGSYNRFTKWCKENGFVKEANLENKKRKTCKFPDCFHCDLPDCTVDNNELGNYNVPSELLAELSRK